jgi:signal transduction histidine kinase
MIPFQGAPAPAGRASAVELQRQIALAAKHPVIDALLESVAAAIAILNPERQLVAANLRYLELAGVESPLGLRPGESLGCVHATAGPDGCGSGRTCLSCGAAIAILSAQREGRPADLECALRRRRGGATEDLVMRARGVPFVLEQERFLLLVLKDISQEKRSAALQRIFLHDLNNLLVGVACASEELAVTPGADELAREIHMIAVRMTRVIALERMLAEDPTRCHAIPGEVSLGEEVSLLSRMVARHPAATGKNLASAVEAVAIETDPVVLKRVLLNMLLNAFEATPEGGEVKLAIEARPEEARIAVWNRGTIPTEVQPRIFQRYFSTREGIGRGQGTFAIRWLGEETLGGRVGFESSEQAGTTFWLTLPRCFPREA